MYREPHIISIPAAVRKIEDYKFDEEAQTITIIFRMQTVNVTLGNPPHQLPDTVWREVYGMENGKLKLIEKRNGKHIPSHFIPEQIIFD